jgi:hypothetical protein
LGASHAEICVIVIECSFGAWIAYSVYLYWIVPGTDALEESCIESVGLGAIGYNTGISIIIGAGWAIKALV